MDKYNRAKFFEADHTRTYTWRCGWLEHALGIWPIGVHDDLITHVSETGLVDGEYVWRIHHPADQVRALPVLAAFVQWRRETRQRVGWPTPGRAARAYWESLSQWRRDGCPGLELNAKPQAPECATPTPASDRLSIVAAIPNKSPTTFLWNVGYQGVEWTVRSDPPAVPGVRLVVVERGPIRQDRATRQKAGQRRRWNLKWNSREGRLSETRDATLLAFRLPKLFRAVQALLNSHAA